MPYSEVVPPEEAHSSAEPSPVAKQTHADASDEASVSNEAATANTARVRPIWPPFEALGPVLRARAFLSVSFGELRAQVRSAVAVPPTFCACRPRPRAQEAQQTQQAQLRGDGNK